MENLKNVAPIEDFTDAYENGESVASASHEERKRRMTIR